MEEEEDTKWKSVLSKSNEVLYYCNKITGQQRWTSQNCFCSKAKNRNIAKCLSPCCIKETTTKGEAKQQNEIDLCCTTNSNLEMSSEVYCLSEIIKEIKTSLLSKKRRRRRSLKLRPKHGTKKFKAIATQSVAKSAKTRANTKYISRGKSIYNSIPKVTITAGPKMLPLTETTITSNCVSLKKTVDTTVPKDSIESNNTVKSAENYLKRRKETNVVNGYKLRPRAGFEIGKYCGKRNKRRKLKVSDTESSTSTFVMDIDLESKPLGSKTVFEGEIIVNNAEEQETNIELSKPDGKQLCLKFQSTDTSVKESCPKTVTCPIAATKLLSSAHSPANAIALSGPPLVAILDSSEHLSLHKEREQVISKNLTAYSLSQPEVKTFPERASLGSEETVCKATTEIGENDDDVLIAARELLSSLPEPKVVHHSAATDDDDERRARTVQQAANIKFVADETLNVGGKGSTTKVQNLEKGALLLSNQKKTTDEMQPFARLESITDALKATSKNIIKGSSSDRDASWFTKIAIELDDLKKNVQLNGTNQVRSKVTSCPGSALKRLHPLENSCGEPLSSVVPVGNSCTKTDVVACTSSSSQVTETRIHPISHNGNVGITTPAAPTTNLNSCTTHRLLPYVTTEVHASYVDLSWRIVTSNGHHSSSLKNFYKLVPVREKNTPADNNDNVFSFLGVPVHGDGQVIAKILNTDVPKENEKVFVFESPPEVSRSVHKGRITLSFNWIRQAVEILPKNISNRKRTTLNLLNPPTREHTISLMLPKPLKLPVAGCKVFLGDFCVKAFSNDVEFNVSHVVTVSTSPRTSLTIPPAALAKSKSKVCQNARCRVQGVTRNDVQNSQHVPAELPPVPKKRQSKPCSFCGAALYCLKDVRRHRRIHSSVGGIKCSECTRRLRTGGRLSVHINTHKCQLQVKCEKCKKFFKTPKVINTDVLAKHYLKRCLECRKEYKCKKCTVTFITLQKLNEHALKTHYLKCGICEETFLYKRDLNRHMKKRHKIASTPPSACISRLLP